MRNHAAAFVLKY